MGPRNSVLSILICLLLAPSLSFSSQSSGVKHQWDVFYTNDKDSLRSLDVYWNDASEEANVILFVHGGGWLSGDKNAYRDMAAKLAGQGMTVILANYRLSPRVKFPAHVEDVAASIAWAATSVVKYNGSPTKMYLMGHSAGGHLVSLAVCDEQYLGRHDLAPSNVAGLITISGVFEIKPQEGGATKKFLGMVFGDDEEVWSQATCQTHIEKSKSGLPPLLVAWVEGEGDLIKNESLNIIRSLKTAGLKYQSFVFEGNEHNAFVTALQDSESGFSKELRAFIAGSQRQN